jgi:hypothetical protein
VTRADEETVENPVVDDVRPTPPSSTGIGSRSGRATPRGVAGLLGRAGGVLVPALAAVLVVLLAVGVWLFVGVRSHDREVTDRAAATAAAEQQLESLLSYDQAALADFQPRIDAATTGEFHDRFTQLFAESVKPSAQAQQAQTDAKAVASGWVGVEQDEVVALVYVNQSTRTQTTPGSRIDTVQAQVTMRKVDDRWLIADLEQV